MSKINAIQKEDKVVYSTSMRAYCHECHEHAARIYLYSIQVGTNGALL